MRAVGSENVQNVTARTQSVAGHDVLEVTVTATLPVAGLFGVPSGLEVTGRAPIESFD